MVFVGLQPFGGERESVLADERRYGNGNPVGAWALMASAVARRDASAKPNGPGNALARRDRRLAETGCQPPSWLEKSNARKSMA